jgi:hypothetical protein
MCACESARPEDRCEYVCSCLRTDVRVCPSRGQVQVCPFCVWDILPFPSGGDRWCPPGGVRAMRSRARLCPRGAGSRWASPGRVMAACAWRVGLRDPASAAGAGWPFLGPSGPGTLLGPPGGPPGVGGSRQRAGCASGPGRLYFKPNSRLRARQLWVCSTLLLTAAAVGAAQPSAAKMRRGPLPLQCCSDLAKPPVTSAEKPTVARLRFLPWCRQYGYLSLGARESN